MKQIMDANINRCSEGIRVLEDLARFHLKNKELSKELRSIRHFIRKLCSKESLLDYRNSSNDIGKEISQGSTVDQKKDIKALVLANFSRVQESMRVLEELHKLEINYTQGKAIEKRRFQIYTLEKKFFKKTVDFSKEIYGITHAFGGRSHVEIAQMYLEQGIRIVQYREKNKPKGEKLNECQAIKKLMEKYPQSIFIINDDLDIAQMVGADGVHLGQEDLDPLLVKKQAPGLIVGVSTHNETQVKRALEVGADYIGVGPMFQTTTKKDVEKSEGVEFLRWVSQNVSLPFVTIGGINHTTIEEIFKNGGQTIAMISALKNKDEIKKIKKYFK